MVNIYYLWYEDHKTTDGIDTLIFTYYLFFSFNFQRKGEQQKMKFLFILNLLRAIWNLYGLVENRRDPCRNINTCILPDDILV